MRSADHSVVLASVLLLAVAIACPARAGRLSDFDLNKLDSWADAVAVCDITRFLLTDPDLRGDVLIVAGSDNTSTALYRPLFVPPNNFFSEIMRQTFENLRKAGQVTPADYGRARIVYAKGMIEAYRGSTLKEKEALADQMALCYHLAVRSGVKVEMKH